MGVLMLVTVASSIFFGLCSHFAFDWCMVSVTAITVLTVMFVVLSAFRQQSLASRSAIHLKSNLRRTSVALLSTATSASNAVDAQGLKRGQTIKIRVSSFGPLGASVQVNGTVGGLVLQKELALFRERRNGAEVAVGEVLDAYVEHVRENGKVDVSLRPILRSRIEQNKAQVLEALREATGGMINVGDKSTPEDIAGWFKGMTKSDFKNAIGSLYKDGLIIPDKHSTTLVPKEYLPIAQSAAAEAHAGKRRKRKELVGNEMSNVDNDGKRQDRARGSETFERDQERSIFVGNLPPTIDIKSLITAVHSVILPDNIVSIRLVKDEHGTPRGFAYLEMAHENLVDEAIAILTGHEVKGRKMRVDYADRERRFRQAAKDQKPELGVGIEPWDSDDENSDVFRRRGRDRGPVGLPMKKMLNVLPAGAKGHIGLDGSAMPKDADLVTGDELVDGIERNVHALTPPEKTGAALLPFTRRDGAVKVYNRRDNPGSLVDWENLSERFEGPAKPSSPKHFDPSRPLPQATLFVGNLAFGATEDVLRQELLNFVPADELASVRVILDRATGESRGYAFVDLYTAEAAEKVRLIVKGVIVVYAAFKARYR
jgi:RNA recognition motif-containing protein